MAELTPVAMELLRQTHDAVVRCEEKLDKKADKEDMDELEEKLSKVENKVHWYSGALAALGAILHLTARP